MNKQTHLQTNIQPYCTSESTPHTSSPSRSEPRVEPFREQDPARSTFPHPSIHPSIPPRSFFVRVYSSGPALPFPPDTTAKHPRTSQTRTYKPPIGQSVSHALVPSLARPVKSAKKFQSSPTHQTGPVYSVPWSGLVWSFFLLKGRGSRLSCYTPWFCRFLVAVRCGGEAGRWLWKAASQGPRRDTLWVCVPKR